VRNNPERSWRLAEALGHWQHRKRRLAGSLERLGRLFRPQRRDEILAKSCLKLEGLRDSLSQAQSR